jgi:hypothetical protein
MRHEKRDDRGRTRGDGQGAIWVQKEEYKREREIREFPGKKIRGSGRLESSQ